MAFGVLAVSYWRKVGTIAAAFFGPLIILSSPPLEVIIVLLLGLITIAQIYHEKDPFHGNHGWITLSFLLILASHFLILADHFLMLIGSDDFIIYLLSKGLQMLGFGIIGLILFRLGRVK